MVRLAKLQLLSKSDPEKALKIAEQMYPQDRFIKSTLEDISKKALGVTTGTEGGFLVPEVLSQEVIPLLYSNTFIFELGTRKLDMPNGNLTIPKLSGGATAYYQGENLPASKSQPKFENLQLKSRKMFTLVPTSNDLIRNSSVSADAIIRDDMIQQMKLKLEWAGVYGDGTDYVPLGITNTTGVQTYTPGALMTADDPATLVGLLKKKNTPMRSPGWVFNSTMEAQIRNLKTTTGAYIYRDEMDTKSTILGIPYKTSEQIATGTDAHQLTKVILADWSEFIFGSEIDFEMMSSQEAAYDIGGGTMVSAFSNDQTIIRVLSKHDFGVRHATSFLVGTFYTVS
jgi:HK97 family phage major capsid protein